MLGNPHRFTRQGYGVCGGRSSLCLKETSLYRRSNNEKEEERGGVLLLLPIFCSCLLLLLLLLLLFLLFLFVVLAMICLLHYLFHLPANFTKNIASHYDLKIDWRKTQYTTLFFCGLPFFSFFFFSFFPRTLQVVIKISLQRD